MTVGNQGNTISGHHKTQAQDEVRVIDIRDLGLPYFIGSEGKMSRIDDNLLDCAVYLYPSEQAAKSGERAGGSGFIVGVKYPPVEWMYFMYVVTNSHVIREANSLFIKMNTTRDDTVIIKSEADHWVHHPYGDDIAAIPIASHDEYIRFSYVKSEHFITKEIIEDYDIGVGDEVMMVGRFISHEGRQKNLPSVRFGNISMMPHEPLKHPRGITQESFLVEMRSIGGFSGSPVFVSVDTSIMRPNSKKMRGVSVGSRPPMWLLGVDWGHISETYPVKYRSGEKHPDDIWVTTNTNMAGVVPAWKLTELLNEEVFVKERKKIGQMIEEMRMPKPDMDVVLDTAEDENVLTRDDFMQVLNQVTRPVQSQEQPDPKKKGT